MAIAYKYTNKKMQRRLKRVASRLNFILTEPPSNKGIVLIDATSKYFKLFPWWKILDMYPNSTIDDFWIEEHAKYTTAYVGNSYRNKLMGTNFALGTDRRPRIKPTFTPTRTVVNKIRPMLLPHTEDLIVAAIVYDSLSSR